jgi:hypothetical protein
MSHEFIYEAYYNNRAIITIDCTELNTAKVKGERVMVKKKKDIKIIERICKVHPSFMAKMTKQLGESGSELLQEDITNCVCVFIAHEGEVKFDIDGNGYIKGDIINWKNFGITTTIKWSSPTRNNIYPDQDVENLDIAFRWGEDFPIKDLKMNSKKKSKRVDSKTYPFNVEYRGELGSDIFIGISISKPEGENCKELLIGAMVEAFENWNANAEKTGTEHIHYLGEVKKIRNRYDIHIDFGNCGVEALEFIINSLANKFKGDSISKIIIE